MKRYLLLLLVPSLVFAFGSGTIKKIDQIENNTGSDIVLKPASDVKIDTFTGNFVLQSGSLKEVEESSVSNTELSYLLGLTSNAQNQINSKVSLTGNESISGIKTFTTQFVATSTTDGFHPAPTMNSIERDAIVGMVAGDLIYNSDDSVLNIYDGAAWVGISGGGVPLLSFGSLLTSNGVVNGELTCGNGESAEWDNTSPEGIKCVTVASGGLPLLTKGALITSDGIVNGELTCGNGESAEWDSTAPQGIKCVTVASGGGDNYLYVDSGVNSFVESAGGGSSNTMAGLTSTFTTNGSGNPVEFVIAGSFRPEIQTVAVSEGDFQYSCHIQLKRDGFDVGRATIFKVGRTDSTGHVFEHQQIETLFDMGSTLNTAHLYSFILVNNTSNAYTIKICQLVGNLFQNVGMTIRQAP